MNFHYEFIEFKSEIPIRSFIAKIGEFAPHLHAEVEIIYVIRGKVNVSVSNKNFWLNSNDFLVVNSQEIHCFHRVDDDNVVLIIQVDPNIPIMSHCRLGLARLQCNSINLSESNTRALNEIRENLKYIINEICMKRKHYELAVYSLILKILTDIFRSFPYHIMTNEEIKFDNENLDRIRKVFQFVEENYMHNISLHDAASLLHLNDYYFAHFFKKHTGLSFGKYLTKIRLEKAKKLIMTSDKPLTDIAMECGFSNVKMLHRAFRYAEGCSPSKYKQSKIREQKSNFGNEKLGIKSYNDKREEDKYTQYIAIIDDSSILDDSNYYFPPPNFETDRINNLGIKEQKLKITFDVNQQGETFKPYWKKLICAGRAAEGLREEWRCQLREIQREIGFEYIRFHGIFHDDMMIYSEKDWNPVFNWQYLDLLLDFLLEINLRPVLELSFMPDQLKSRNKTVFWWKGNVTPPKDYSKWSKLVKELVIHCVNRYGKSEVLKWYFEVWNEPNHPSFWAGTQEEYFLLYKHTAEAIKTVDGRLRVGGPAIFQGGEREAIWLREFLNFCESNKLPVDFVSCHCYPADVAVDKNNDTYIIYKDENTTYSCLQSIRDIIKQSGYKNSEIIITEWNSSFSARDFVHDTIYKAPFIIQNVIKCMGLVDALGWWAFTDIFEELPIDNRMFHGGFGIINIQGLKKPSYYGYWFLSRLGTEKITSGDYYFVTRKEDSIQVLIWNYCHYSESYANGNLTRLTKYDQNGLFNEKKLHVGLHISGLKKEKYRVIEYIFDRNHGSVFDVWINMGAPENVTKEELDILKKKTGPEGIFYTIKDEEEFQKDIVIEPHGVYLLELYKILE